MSEEQTDDVPQLDRITTDDPTGQGNPGKSQRRYEPGGDAADREDGPESADVSQGPDPYEQQRGRIRSGPPDGAPPA